MNIGGGAVSAPLRVENTVAHRLLVASAVLLGLSWVAAIAVQYADHDFLPPSISLSQYGVGSSGWLFTAYSLGVAFSALFCYEAQSVRSRTLTTGYFVGAIGIVTMGLVRTDTGGEQASWHAIVHLIGAIVGLVTLPLVTWWTARTLGRTMWWICTSLMSVSSVSLLLLILAAVGLDTAGVGAAQSWALWQAVAVVADQIMITVVVLAGFRRVAAPTRHRTR